jgi:hypothetical protein
LLTHQPDWCIGPITGLVWYVRNPGSKKPSKINFDYPLPNGKRLPDYPNLLETSRRLVRLMRDGPNATLHTGDTLAQFAGALRCLVCSMVLEDKFRFRELTGEDAKDYALRARFGVQSVLDIEDRLDKEWNKLTQRAGFAPTDSADERISKARKVVPLKKGSGANSKLDGFELLRRLGFETEQISGLLSTMLRRFELECHSAGGAEISVEDIEEELVTDEQLRRLLMPLAELYAHRRFLNDALKMHPFNGQSAGVVARQLGREVGRTKLPSIAQAVTFIDRCARWVLHYAPALLAEAGIRFQGDQVKSGGKYTVEVLFKGAKTSGPSSPFPLSTGRGARRGAATLGAGGEETANLSLKRALSFLSVACAVLIAVFSARRASEICGLRSGCINFDAAGDPWMRVFIHKNLQQEVSVPVPRSVVAAISVLEALSKEARETSGTDFLFQRMWNGQVIGLSKEDKLPVFGFGVILGEFSVLVDTPRDDEGRKWIFRPHQFRKLFAVLYVWAYGGRLSTLSWFLMHNDLDMTWRYASDETLGQYIAMADRQKTATVLTQAALGQAEFKGPAAREFNELAASLYDEYAQSTQVISEARLHERIIRHVESAQIVITGFPWGYCGRLCHKTEEAACGASATATQAELLQKGSLVTCGECSLSFDTIEFHPFVVAMMRRNLEVVNAGMAPAIILNASRCVVSACTKRLETWETKRESQ